MLYMNKWDLTTLFFLKTFANFSDALFAKIISTYYMIFLATTFKSISEIMYAEYPISCLLHRTCSEDAC